MGLFELQNDNTKLMSALEHAEELPAAWSHLCLCFVWFVCFSVAAFRGYIQISK